jgi:uncharacterized protein (DUF1330 family)
MPAYLIVETDIHDPEQYEHYKAASRRRPLRRRPLRRPRR